MLSSGNPTPYTPCLLKIPGVNAISKPTVVPTGFKVDQEREKERERRERGDGREGREEREKEFVASGCQKHFCLSSI